MQPATVALTAGLPRGQGRFGQSAQSLAARDHACGGIFCNQSQAMRNEALETRVQAHIIEQVPACLEAWHESLSLMAGASRPQGESPLVQVAGLAQRTRPMVRLLGDEHAETAAVALETLVTMLLDGDLLYAGEARKAMLAGAEAIRITLSSHVEKSDTDQEIPWAEDHLHHLQVETVYRLLHAIRGHTAANAYGGPCVAFPVQHSGQDGAPLRLRGFDLYRIEMEDLHVYLVEMPWDDVLERPNGLSGLFDYVSRNGHVFDARPAWSACLPNSKASCCSAVCCTSPPDADLHFAPFDEAKRVGVLRLLCGSSLDPDFLEVLLQLPGQCIHRVNPQLVRRHKASWTPVKPSDEPQEPVLRSRPSKGARKSIEELTLEYTKALNTMFATSKDSPRDEALPDHLF